MFTGIVTEVGRVISRLPDQLSVRAGPILKNIELGGSISVNGVCLTVIAFDAGSFAVGLAQETIQRTNLGALKNGDPVNLERPLGLGGELGGHLVQGHVDGTGRITAITPESGASRFRFEAPPEIMHYLVEKGFIAIEGISLTIAERGSDYFQVSVIDYTRNNTNLKFYRIGDSVNLEVDILSKYVEQSLRAQQPALSEHFLRENGF
ncbi:MAG TPA: riboflavin synthase [Dehalococcoidales bacterium]